MNNTKVTIYLDTLDSNEVRGESELIFQKQYRQLLRKIRQKAYENKALLDASVCKDRKGESQEGESRGTPTCFFIDGSRGSGKSTLMRAVRGALIDGKDYQEDEPQIALYSLADVDPTELGKGENFFLYLLGRIYKILEDQFAKSYFRDEDAENIRSAMEDLRQMSGGLQVLMDSEGALKNDDSPDFFLENCVEKCADSSLLRKRLNELLGKVAKIVHREVFLVTIDDADLNFSKCEDVLEYVRKYLQCARLIFLFAGDMHLYAHIVRGLNINHFNEKQLRYDSSHAEQRNRLLNQLEEQYLLKLFPVDHRVHTPGLANVLEGNCQIFIQENVADETKLSLRNCIQKYVAGKFIPEAESAFIDTIVNLPARSVFFLLRYLSKNPYSGDVQKSAKYVWDGIHVVFLQSLVKFNLEHEQIENGNIEQLQKSIFQYCSQAQLWNSDLTLLPAAADVASRQVALYLSGAVSRATQSMSSKLLYWCACFPAWQSIREYYLSCMDARKTQEWLGDFLKYGGGGHHTKWANMACGCMAPKMDDVFLFGRGTICVLNHDAEQNNEKGSETRYGIRTLLQKLLEERNELDAESLKLVVGVHSSLCRVDDNENSYFYLSVYHLLMNVVDWLEFGSRMLKSDAGDIEKGGTEAEQTKQRALRQGIRARLAGMRIIPDALRIGSSSNAAPKNTSSLARLSHVYEGLEDESIVDELYSWLMTYEGVSYSSAPASFSRAWDAFLAKCAESTGNLKVEYEYEEECPKAGKIFQQYMFAVEYALSRLSSPEGRNLADCVMTFPFWKSLNRPDECSRHCLEILNTAHIGDYVNLRKKTDVLSKKKAYEDAEVQASRIEKKKEEIGERIYKETQLLSELKKEMQERKVKKELCASKMMDFEYTKSEIRKKINSLLVEEKSTVSLVERLTKEENKLNVECNLAAQKVQSLEEIRLGLLEPLKAKDKLLAEIKRSQKLLKNAKREETKRRHEQDLKRMQAEWNAYQLPQSTQVTLEVIQQAGNTKNEVNNQHKIIVEQLADAKARERSLKMRRESEARALSELQRREETFGKMDFDADVSYQVSQMKYEHQKKQVDDLARMSEEVSKLLEQKQIICAAAKSAYENAKKQEQQI